jgi:hypothetical protein
LGGTSFIVIFIAFLYQACAVLEIAFTATYASVMIGRPR